MKLSGGGGGETVPPIGWRVSIIEQLNNRKYREEKPFEELINFCCRLFEGLALYSTNPELGNFTKYSHGSTEPLSSDQGETLKKLYRLQEELARMLERKEDQTATIKDLQQQLDIKESERSEFYARLCETELNLTNARAEICRLEKQLTELKTQLQFERDEHAALRILFEDLSKKLSSKTHEADHLLIQLKAMKAADAEKLNELNEREEKLLREKKRHELETAAASNRLCDYDEGSTSPADQGEMACVPTNVIAIIPERALCSTDAHDGDVYALRWCSSQGLGGRFCDMIATGGSDRKIKLWQVTSSQIHLKETLVGSNGGITSIDISNDLILASSYDYTCRIWGMFDGKLRRTLTGHADKVLTVKFSILANKCFSGSQDRTIRVWDYDKYACTKTLYPGSTCNDLVLGKGQEVVISGHFDKKIRLWDLRTECSVHEIFLPSRITSLDLSSSGQYLLACVRDDTLRLMDLRMNKVVETFSADSFKVGTDLARATISPDNDHVVAGSHSGSIFIWNVNSAKVDRILKNHSSPVGVASWNPQGHLLASCEKNKKLIIWN
ncbi:autophagy-related protein 16-1-like isoform X5 [Panonychus citri]|uniref:autophagy-related protein 16-1-like isoform X5 n=1 Tax=Panonychus citri TaxID=50023 RepID=UPI00230804AF|nr:autophagy-related protein 16-1-like isoform X5 [Panonychus citri]